MIFFRVHYFILYSFTCRVSCNTHIKLTYDSLSMISFLLFEFSLITKCKLVWFYWKLFNFLWLLRRGKIKSRCFYRFRSKSMLNCWAQLFRTSHIFFSTFRILKINLIYRHFQTVQKLFFQSYFNSIHNIFHWNIPTSLNGNLSNLISLLNFKLINLFFQMNLKLA
jgi:hypothetical protein